jgi:hypothetical protein
VLKIDKENRKVRHRIDIKEMVYEDAVGCIWLTFELEVTKAFVIYKKLRI